MDSVYWELQSDGGGQKVVESWLDGISPSIGCKCGNLLAPRSISVVMDYDFGDSVMHACLFDNDNNIKGGTIPIVDRKLVETIGVEHFSRCFFLGDVSFVHPKGKRKYYSMVPRSNAHLVIIRGGEHIGFRFCSRCKEFPQYSQGYPFRPYLLHEHVSENHVIYPIESHAFLVRSDYMESIKSFGRTFHKLRIPVLKEPQDGLPVDLYSLPRDFRKIP